MFRVGVAYVVMAWLLAQVADLALDSFEAPSWVIKTILLLLVLGFPIAIFFAWAFELTPEGLKREKEVDRSRSITKQTGRKLDYAIIGILFVAVVFLLTDKFWLQTSVEDSPAVTPDVVHEEIATADDNSIAVLPFVDMSPDKDQEYFTDGLTENLLHALAQIRELKVTGRTSSFAFKGQNEDLRSIGEQLNVLNILEGSVQKSGNRIRITAQLVNASDGYHLWSQVFDRSLDDIFEIQDEIATAVVAALRESILDESEINTGYHGSAEAYNAFLQGEHFVRLATDDSWERAIEYYEQALEIDPEMAIAWAGLANAVATQTGRSALNEGAFSEGYERAREIALKALELDPMLPEAHLALGRIYGLHDWDWEATEQAFRTALELRPGDADIIDASAGQARGAGDFSRSFELTKQAIALDPLNLRAQVSWSRSLHFQGRYEEALAAMERTYAAFGNVGNVPTYLAFARMSVGDYDGALAALETEKLDYQKLTGTAVVYAKMGDHTQSRKYLDELISKYGDAVSWQQVEVYATLGDKDKAFEAMDRAYDIRDPGITSILFTPLIEPLRDDPRYFEMLQRLNLAD